MEAREIMSKDPVVVTPGMPLAEATGLLMHYRIHGAPVVDAAGQLVGMLSLVDLAGRIGRNVRDVMASQPLSASEDASVEEIAAMMLEQMVRRIPIVRGGRVVGIVSVSDIIQLFLNLHEQGGTERKTADAVTQRGASGDRLRPPP